MLTDAEIESLAQNHIRPAADVELLYCEKKSDPDGIYFCANRLEDPYIGPGGFFVTRASGEVWTFNSGQVFHEGLDSWLKWYADGWRPGIYRLVVHDVRDPIGFARLLIKHGITFLVREIDHGVVWKNQADYNEDTVLQRLRNLPCAFAMDARPMSEMLSTLRSEKFVTFDYSYIGAAPTYDWRPENSTAEQLGAQWEWPG